VGEIEEKLIGVFVVLGLSAIAAILILFAEIIMNKPNA